MDLRPYLDQGLYKSYGFSMWLKLKPDHLSAMVYSFFLVFQLSLWWFVQREKTSIAPNQVFVLKIAFKAQNHKNKFY